MRRSVLALLLCACPSTLLAEPPGSLQIKEPQQVIFRVQPPGGVVYAQVASAGTAWLPPGVSSIGKTNEVITIDLAKIRDGKMTFFVGGEVPSAPQPPPGYQKKIPDFHGYQVLTGFVPKEAIRFIDKGILYHPLQGSGPLLMQPAPGFGAWMQRTLYWFQIHYLVTFTLLALGGAGIFSFVAIFIPRQKAWREEYARITRFNERLRNLDVQNDVFLGRQFGEWATVKRLGQGGMAVVYKGVSVKTMDDKDAVAVKVMNPELAQDQEYRKRFKREVQISTTLDHPNVVRMIDHGEQDNVLYLAMEYIEGETMRDMLPEKGLPLREAIPLALGIVAGLIHAHQKGVVHRDLKPDNVMVTTNRLVKVMDLGLAKREESENVTRTGDTFGTPAYMAPEQITGGTLLPATDQYALGVMLFELVTGRRPFEVADSLTLVMKHLQEPPPRIREYKSQLPEELDQLIDRMLVKDPAKRFKSLVDVQVELTKIQRKYCPE